MRASAAIVTTLRNAGAVLDSFIAWHRAIGFSHLFLFFDDPSDPDISRIQGRSDVTAIACDENLRSSWRRLRTWAQMGPFIDREVMARQVLNVEIAMALAREHGCDWLLSIDGDELFFSAAGNAAEVFDRLSSSPFDTVQFLNYEAVPVRDEIADAFREVDLFKPSLRLLPPHLEPALREVERTVPQLRPWFHFYANGKAAVRLSDPSLEPFGVHQFRRAAGATRAAISPAGFILHYAVCGFEAFWTKYATLGRFSDKWFGAHEIAPAIGTFHLEARDVVARGDREAARAFYRARAVISDPVLLERLTRLGLLAQFREPGRVLAGPS